MNNQQADQSAEPQPKSKSKEHKEDLDLPKSIIQRIVKSKLSEVKPADSKEFTLSKDALLAMTECAKVFVSYLTATAYEICKENKKQTLGAEEVLVALADIEMPEHIPPLRIALEKFRSDEAEKKKAHSKRKQEQGGAEEQEADKKPKVDAE